MLRKFLESLTYIDSSGKRKPYTFVTAGLFVLLVGLLVWGWSVYISAQSEAQVLATPRPLATEISPAEAPTVTATAAPMAAYTPNPGCPKDSKQWTLKSTSDGTNLMSIEPACLYAGLARTIAWQVMAIGLGYTHQEAQQFLGFPDFPADARTTIEILPADGRDPVAVNTSWPDYNPSHEVWSYVSDASTGMTYSVQGCYRTYEIVGDEQRYWWDEWKGVYSVLCQIAGDTPGGWGVERVNDKIYAAPYEAGRTVMIFGYYDIESEWIFIGFTGRYSMTDDEMKKDRATTGEVNGSPVWSAEDLQQLFNIPTKPLPVDWQTHTSEADRQALMAELNTK